MSKKEQVQHASKNCQIAEEYAQKNIPGANWIFGEYDGETADGVHFDVKGVEIVHNRSDKQCTSRIGRVTLRREQNDGLCKHGGFYYCIVIDTGIIIKEFTVPAVNVVFGENSQTKNVAWTTFAKMAVVT